MCKKLFFLFVLFSCFLPAAQAIEITESELATLETLISKQQETLEKSKAELKASNVAQTKSQKALKQAQTISSLQLQEIQALKAQSAKLQLSISKSATSYAQLEIEKTKIETELKTKISILNKVCLFLSVIVAGVILYFVIKIALKIKGLL